MGKGYRLGSAELTGRMLLSCRDEEGVVEAGRADAEENVSEQWARFPFKPTRSSGRSSAKGGLAAVEWKLRVSSIAYGGFTMVFASWTVLSADKSGRGKSG